MASPLCPGTCPLWCLWGGSQLLTTPEAGLDQRLAHSAGLNPGLNV